MAKYMRRQDQSFIVFHISCVLISKPLKDSINQRSKGHPLSVAASLATNFGLCCI